MMEKFGLILDKQSFRTVVLLIVFVGILFYGRVTMTQLALLALMFPRIPIFPQIPICLQILIFRMILKFIPTMMSMFMMIMHPNYFWYYHK